MSLFQRSAGRNWAGVVRDLLFFILFYLYLWLVIEPCLIYHGNGMTVRWPVFFTGWAFFQNFLSYPGGLIEYLGAFLFQFFQYSGLGAAIITVLSWLICWCTDTYFKTVNAPRLRWVRFIPPVLILVLYSQYTYYLATITAVLVSLLFTCLYLKFASKNKVSCVILFLILSMILYPAAGSAYLLFAVLCAIYEGFFIRRWYTGLMYLVLAVIVPYAAGVIIFKVSISDAFVNLLPFSWRTSSEELHPQLVLAVIYSLCLFLPVITLILGLWRLFKPASFKVETQTSPSIFKWIAASLVLLLLAGGAVFATYDRRIKTMCAIDYYAYHKMWPQVLRVASNYPDNYFVTHAVNQALFHTGQLGSEMFAWPQHYDALFLTNPDIDTQWKRAGLYMDLGLFNMAEKSLSESLEQLGPRPAVLTQLAMVNLVNGNTGAARIYLGTLRKTLFYAEWANDYLTFLKSDSDLLKDKDIAYLRRVKMTKDYNFIAYKTETTVADFEGLLLDLLETNRQNRMAFEYLMTYYLLTKQLDKFILNLDRLDDFGDAAIPRHYEEAILIYQGLNNKEINLKGRRISSTSLRRFRTCVSTLAQCDGMDKNAVMSKLAKDFGDSYFFYYYLCDI